MKKSVLSFILGLFALSVLGGATAYSQAATKLAITDVNGGLSPHAGVPFNVTVQSQDGLNSASNVVLSTTVTLTLKTGAGVLGGTLTGNIPSGSNSVVISGVTYTKAEPGVALTAAATAGDSLTSGDSSPFTVLAGPAATISLTSGNSQNAQISTALGSPFVVTVTDAGSNPVPGVSVTFAIATTPLGAAGQVLSTTTTTTNGSGQATSTLTLGSKVGSYTVTATSGTLTGSPVTFTATATTGNAATISLTSGNNQNAQISTPLGLPFVVTVLDAGGNPVNGTSVTFAIATTPLGAAGQVLSTTTTTTNGSGQATSTLTLGSKVGSYTVTATSAGLAGSPVTFTATATTGPAATISLTSGNNQGGQISTALASPFVVTVTDAGGNPVSGTGVTFVIATFPGGAVGQLLSTGATTTDVNGHASSTLTLGNKAGAYTVTATSGSLAGSPVTFTATATTGTPTTISLTFGNNQNAKINTALGTPFVVTVTDAGSNPVPGVSVTFAIATTPSGAGGQLLSTLGTTTNGSGQASSTLTLGSKVGSYTVTATSTGLTGSPVTFTATATPGNAATIGLTSGNNQSALISAPLALPFVVTVLDAGGNPVNGTSVTFAIATTPLGAAGQVLSTTTTTTNGSGQASSTLTLGSKVGSYTVTATSAGLAGSPVTFTATANTGPAATISLTSGNNQSAQISTALGSPFVVTVTDAGGNPVTGTSVTFAIASTPGGAAGQSLSTGLTTTDVNGHASSTLTLGNKAGAYTVTATSGSLAGSPVTFTATATTGGATTIALTSGNNQSAQISTALASPFVVTVTDAGSNPVSGVSVTFAIATTPGGAAGQVLSTTTTTTDVSGHASSTLTLGNKVGSYTVTATSGSLTGSPVTFTATATVGSAATISLTSGNNQSGQISTSLAFPFVVTVTDAGSNPVSGVSVTFAIATTPGGAAGQVLSTTTTTTDVSGHASSTLTLGDKVGSYTVTATSGSLAGSPVTFTATASTGGLTHFTVEQTGGGLIVSQTAGASFSIRLVARDAGNNVVTTFTGAGNTVNITSNGTLTQGAGTTGAFSNGVLDPWAVTISNTGTDSITATRTSGGTEKGTSNAFTVAAGALSNFLVENFGGGTIPQQTAGAAFNIRLTARDANNNTVTGFTGSALLTSNAALVGSPLTTSNFVAGVLGSQSVTVTLAGSANRTITATAGGPSGTSAPFTVVASAPASIAVSAGDNQSAAVGAAFPVAMAALVADAFGNPVNGATVTFASPVGGASGTWTGNLHSTTVPTNASGLATVPLTFTANSTAGAYVDTARVAGAGIPALFHLTNTPAAASKLVIVTPPSTPDVAGNVFSTQPVIWIEDVDNNLVASFNGTVLAARATGTGALAGLTTVTAVNGVATFSNLSYNVAETITITFSSPSNPTLTAATTGNIVVQPGVPSTVAFVVQPSTATAGVAITPAVTAQVRDAFANVITTAGIPITMAINTGTGVLSGTLTQNTIANGSATFANLSIDLSGAKTLIATSGTYTSAISGPFTINPAAANRVAFVQEPTNASSGAAITPAITVQLKDPFGNNATTPLSSVTLALLTGTGTLNGTVTQPTNGAGLATFGGLSINQAGAKTLRATDGALTPDTSAAFSIAALPASKLVFVQGPSNAVAGASIVPPVTVQIQDSFGNNIAVGGTTVTLTLNGTGSLDGTPPTQITDSFGVATFNNLTVDLIGSKTLTAQASGLASATSLPFTISAAAASQLAFTTQPGGGTAGAAFVPQPVLTLQDAFGNTVTGLAQNVTLALQANPGADVLGGTTTVAVNTGTGQAVFSGLSLTHAATGYTLTATGNSVATLPGSVVSGPFNVVHAAASEVRVETLVDGSGVVLPAQNVSSGTSITVYSIARDQYHNFISDTVATWSLVSPIGVVPTDLVPSGDGRSATFTGRLIGTASIRAATTGIGTSVQSGVLTVVVAGVPSKILVETSANGTGVILPDSVIPSGRAITVFAIARDNAGNFVRNVSANWSVQNASGGVVTGDLTPSAGKSTVFTGHVIGTGQIRADSAGLTAVTSGTVTVIHGSAANVTATVGSGQSVLIGSSFATNLQATVRDSSNNLVGAGVLVTFSAPGSGAGGTFPGGATTAPVLTTASSVATAPLFTANKTAGTYADSARIAGGSLPALFVLTNTPGVATLITPAAGTTPQHVQIANPFPVALAVVATDSSGNRVPGVTVTFTPPGTASSGTFVGNATVVSDLTGTATAPAYIANAVSGPDTVKATSAGVSAPARFILTNDPAGAQNIVVTRTQLDTAVVNTAFKDSLQVAVKDQFNNPVSGIWVTFTAPSAGASVLFARTGKPVDSALTTSAGLATSSALTANTVTGDYQIIARAPSISGTATFFRTNKPGPVTRFAIGLSPNGSPIGTQIATAPFDVLITARDVYNNVSSFPGTGTVNINVTSNGPLTAGGGIVAFNTGLIQTMVFQGAGASDTINVVRVGGAEKGASNAFAVVNPVPTVTSITPPNGRKGQVLDVVIGGTGFIGGTSVPSLGGSIVPVSWTVNSSTQMTVTISISSNARDSAYSVSVINGAPGGGTGTLQGGFTVGLTPAPKILSVLPTSGGRLQTFNLVVRGSNFYGGVSVLSLGAGIKINTATVDSVNQLTAGITVLSAAATGPRDVIVVNNVPAGTGGGTDTLKGGFTVVNPLPTVYDVAPGGAPRLSAVTLGISGTNFIGGVSTVSLGDTGIAVNSVTVDSATHITAAIVIGSGATAGAHTVSVTNTGLGGGTASLPNSFTVLNPVPSLTTVQPNAANRSQTLNIVFRGSNFVRGGSSVLFKPSNDITVNAVSVDSTTQITASVTIGPNAVVGQRLVAVYNPPPGGDTSGSIGFTVNLTAPPIPVLLVPGNGSAFQPTTVALRWLQSTGATGYHVQFARVQTFLPPAVDTVVTDTSMVVGPLTMNTTYYWHVAAVGASSTSSFSVPWSFVASYPARVAILDTVVFPARSAPTDYLSTDYRLIGLPGSGPLPVQNYLPGTAGTDWWMVWDNGQPANYWVPYAAGSPFVFGAGRGFWLVKKGNWVVKDTVASAVLDGNGMAAIALHTGWNIITDPFLATVNWSDITAANPPTQADHPVFTYSNGWPQTTLLQTYTGYYFENTDSLSFLQIPFRSAPVAAKKAAADGSWRIRLDLEAGGFVDQVTTLGVSPVAGTGKNALDYHRPRLMNGIPALVLARPEWDAVNREFATDIRPPVQNAEVWKFEVRTSLRTPAKITFRNVAAVPDNFQVYLIDEGRARSADLRAASEYPFVPPTDVSAFRLVVGTPDALRRELDALLPKTFELGNNFPNPFNPETTIPVSVPFASEVRLVVYNILGSEVRTVFAGPVEAGRYWFKWDGRNEHGNPVATGVYFVRLTTNRGLAFIRKMAFVK